MVRYRMRHTNIAFTKIQIQRADNGSRNMVLVILRLRLRIAEMMFAWLFWMFTDSHITWTCYLIRNTVLFFFLCRSRVQQYPRISQCEFEMRIYPRVHTKSILLASCVGNVFTPSYTHVECIAFVCASDRQCWQATGIQQRLMIVYQRLLPVLLDENTQHYPSATTNPMARIRSNERMQRNDLKVVSLSRSC